MLRSEFNIEVEVKDSVFNPNDPAARSKNVAFYIPSRSEDDYTYYHVWIYLEGPGLPFVKKVTYTLHKTFRNPVRVVERSSTNQNCALEIITWGIFTVHVEIEDVRGNVTILDHKLTYGDQINEGGNINWVNRQS